MSAGLGLGTTEGGNNTDTGKLGQLAAWGTDKKLIEHVDTLLEVQNRVDWQPQDVRPSRNARWCFAVKPLGSNPCTTK
ncbi:hypothetical protein MBH78_01445 [Oceanimonas sp. NS1]|nr:hypothetical protein [Oceanimonas sp. NS1]